MTHMINKSSQCSYGSVWLQCPLLKGPQENGPALGDENPFPSIN